MGRVSESSRPFQPRNKRVQRKGFKMTTNTKTKKTHEPIQDLEGEVWKPIKGYEGLYEVSNMGRVKSLNYGGLGVVRIMKRKPQKSKYLRISSYKDGERKQYFVHRLVYEAFHGNLPKFKSLGIGNGDKMIVINHKDENPSNNCLSNLELVSHTENVNYGTALKRRCESQKNKRNSKKVYQYTTRGELVMIWPSTMECHRNGFNFKNVAACCAGKRKHCLGYIWSYKPLSIEECLELKPIYPFGETKKVYQYSKDHKLIKIWKSGHECQKGGFNQVSVSRCCRKKQPYHKGYIWSFTPLFND